MKEKIEARLRELIPSRDETVFEAARYSLLSEGKRIRPLLALSAAAAFGADPLLALDPACAIEMIHTYSLIHDDLPCMDNDSLRRGKPTLHKVFGEAIALLAGDYLLTFAFEILANAKNLSAEQKLQMVQTVSSCAGSPGMIGGQAIDVESEGKEIDEEILLQMHYGKTGALIVASLECGRIAAAADCSLLTSIGFELGLIYQLQDDLLNATSTTAVLGKTVGTDAASQKSTAISVYGLKATQEKLDSLHKSLSQKLAQLPNQGTPLTALIQNVLHRTF